MRRIAIGSLLVLHGLAHSSLGVWSSAFGSPWIVTPLWLAAQLGFMVAGIGVLGVPWARRVWRKAAILGALGSVLLMSLFVHPVLLWGVVIDAVVLFVGIRWREPTLPAHADAALLERAVVEPAPIRSRRHRVASMLATSMICYVAVVIAARPWYMHWGTSTEERDAVLPGDGLVPVANYRSDHAITIHAPADSVWPWLAQLGQDRGGFYSYDRLERLIGDDVHNADRIHPEWQTVQEGDLVRAVQPDYLGGRLGGELGWRVVEVVPRRALVLRGWGAFVVRPLDSATTRLHIRIRGSGEPRFLSAAMGPFGLFVFEPAHFIMERRMLIGIRARAEGRVRPT
jgi:hypothetical protein